MKKVVYQSALLFIFALMLVIPFQAHAETSIREGFYIVKGQQGVYYPISDLFDTQMRQRVLDEVNDAGFSHTYIVLDGRIATLYDFAFLKLQGVPITAETMPPVFFVDYLGNELTFPWHGEWLEVIDVQ
ncbi:hypothetical protein [Anoxybacillus sp.]|uniref:hypothetical protein n=1 Tax=Anoxybacillus sp. TaxID=1872573 RepID=UPI0026130079|nr:hypothetical protein [uncultured Anoxybacillus sp.]